MSSALRSYQAWEVCISIESADGFKGTRVALQTGALADRIAQLVREAVLRPVTLASGLMLALAGCGPAVARPAAHAPAARPVPANRQPATASHLKPRLSDALAAGRYLALAYNRHDTTALRGILESNSYPAVGQMRSEAVNLRLVSCQHSSDPAVYGCLFQHDYPAGAHKPGKGLADFDIRL